MKGIEIENKMYLFTKKKREEKLSTQKIPKNL